MLLSNSRCAGGSHQGGAPSVGLQLVTCARSLATMPVPLPPKLPNPRASTRALRCTHTQAVPSRTRPHALASLGMSTGAIEYINQQRVAERHAKAHERRLARQHATGQSSQLAPSAPPPPEQQPSSQQPLSQQPLSQQRHPPSQQHSPPHAQEEEETRPTPELAAPPTRIPRSGSSAASTDPAAAGVAPVLVTSAAPPPAWPWFAATPRRRKRPLPVDADDEDPSCEGGGVHVHEATHARMAPAKRREADHAQVRPLQLDAQLVQERHQLLSSDHAGNAHAADFARPAGKGEVICNQASAAVKRRVVAVGFDEDDEPPCPSTVVGAI